MEKINKDLSKSLGILLLVITFASACRSESVTQSPERKYSTVSIPPQESALSIRVNVEYAALEKAFNAVLPTEFSESGHGEDVCVGRICVGTKYKYTVKPSSAFRLSVGSNSSIKATLSLSAKGKGGFRGDGARLLGLDAKNFEGTADLHANMKWALDEDWCPRVQADIGYRWTHGPRLEIVDRVYIDIKDEVDKQLRPEIKKAVDNALSAINCGQFRKALMPVWTTHSLPVEIPNEEIPMYINFTPTEMGTSDAITKSSHLSLVVGLSGEAEVSTSGVPPRALGELPPRKVYFDDPGTLRIRLPIRAEYGVLEKLLTNALAERAFEAPTPLTEKHAIVHIIAVEVYPNGSKLGIGLRFKADLPGRPLDVSGTVFLTGRPRVEGDKERIAVDDLDFTQTLDNKVWSAVAAVFRGPILESLRKNANFDFGDQVRTLKASLEQALVSHEYAESVVARVTNLKVQLHSVVPEEKAVAALVSADARVEFDIIAIPDL